MNVLQLTRVKGSQNMHYVSENVLERSIPDKYYLYMGFSEYFN